MSHDYSNQSTEEDPRMMAFFDSLVQRELEGWSTDDNAQDSESGMNYQPFVVRGDTTDDSNSDTLSNHSLHSGEEEGGLSPFTMAFAIAMARRARQTENGDGGENAARPEDFLDVHSSFLERLDELSNTEGAAEGPDNSNITLPGQRPNSARKSITELINLKRKDYLTKAKHEKAPIRRKLSLNRPIRKQIAMNKEGTTCFSSSSCSSNSSSSSSLSSGDSCTESGGESEEDKTTKKTKTRKGTSKTKRKTKMRKLDLDSSPKGEIVENLSTENNHNAADVIKELAAERDKIRSRMKRLKAIRNRAMLDLSDSSDSDKGATTSQNREKNTSDYSTFPLLNASTEPDGQAKLGRRQPSNTLTSLDVNKEKDGTVNENGLESDSKIFALLNTGTETVYGLGKNGLETCDNMSKNEPFETRGIQNGNVSNIPLNTPPDAAGNNTCPKRAPFSSFCDSEANNSVTNLVNGHTSSVNVHCNSIKHPANLVNGHNSSVSNGASASDGDAASVDSQPIWTEFKRFRSRVEKAHRRYRKSVSHRENSTCSSGEES